MIILFYVVFTLSASDINEDTSSKPITRERKSHPLRRTLSQCRRFLNKSFEDLRSSIESRSPTKELRPTPSIASSMPIGMNKIRRNQSESNLCREKEQRRFSRFFSYGTPKLESNRGINFAEINQINQKWESFEETNSNPVSESPSEFPFDDCGSTLAKVKRESDFKPHSRPNPDYYVEFFKFDKDGNPRFDMFVAIPLKGEYTPSVNSDPNNRMTSNPGHSSKIANAKKKFFGSRDGNSSRDRRKTIGGFRSESDSNSPLHLFPQNYEAGDGGEFSVGNLQRKKSLLNFFGRKSN